MTARVERAFETFRERLLGFLRRRVPTEHDAEDVLQDVFLKLAGGLDALADEDRLEAYVFQTARRAVADFHRRRAAPGSLAGDVAAEPVADDAGASACIRPLLAELSSEDREALELAELGGLTQAELASRLGLSLTGGKSRVQRARQRLGAVLRACCRFELDGRRNVLAMHPRRPSTC